MAAYLGDKKSIAVMLSSFSAVPDVLYARATILSGSRQTTYKRIGVTDAELAELLVKPGRSNPPSLLASHTYHVQPIVFEHFQVGEFELVLENLQVKRSMNQIFLATALVLLLSLICAVLLGRYLKQQFFQPIMNLREIMNEQVEAHATYTRLELSGQYEIDDLYQGYNHMVHTIENRDAAIARHQEQLQQKFDQRGEVLDILRLRRNAWLESLAHFLRHELTNKILGFSSTLDMFERKDTKGELAVYITRARRSTQQMQTLLINVASVSSIEAAIETEDKSRLDFSLLVKEVLNQFCLDHPTITIEGQLEKGVWTFGNESRLIQLTTQLFANAVKHGDLKEPIKIRLALAGTIVKF